MFFRKKNIDSTFSDQELIREYKTGGDSHWVGVLFQRYSHLAFGVSMKYLKDEEESRDAVMQVFEKLLNDLKVHQVENFKFWLHTVVKNHCLMKLRKDKKMGYQSEDFDSEVMEYTYTLHHTDEKLPDEAFQHLDDCIDKLVEEQKQCVRMFYLEERCYKEIADLTQYDLNKVKSYIQNGKRNLKICMEKSDLIKVQNNNER